MIVDGMDVQTVTLIDEFKEDAELTLPRTVTADYIETLIQDFGSLNYAYSVREHEYHVLKHNYEVELITLKYSEEYVKFKSLERKKEEAVKELAHRKQELLDVKYQLTLLKGRLEEVEKTLRLCFMMYGRENHE